MAYILSFFQLQYYASPSSNSVLRQEGRLVAPSSSEPRLSAESCVKLRFGVLESCVQVFHSPGSRGPGSQAEIQNEREKGGVWCLWSVSMECGATGPGGG